MKKIFKAFTLVELLVVMAILGILVTLVGGSFRNAQRRGRDTQRKSDLKQLANSFELFYQDYGYYPSADGQGRIVACPYAEGTSGVVCTWGVGQFCDVDDYNNTRTIYFKKLPQDPVKSYQYFYRVPDTSQKKFQIFARLENSEDQDCLSGKCTEPGVTYSCGSDICNFAITSSNTDPFE